MTPNEKIDALYRKHYTSLVQFARYYLNSGSSMYAEDVVQEVFIKVLMILREEPNKEINENYLRRAVVTMTKDDLKRKTDPLKNPSKIPYNLQAEEKEKPRPDAREIMEDVDKIVETFYTFDRLLFNAYRYEFRSIRKLSKATKIGHVQVFQTVKRCKERINDKLKYKYYGKE